jgi:hypothetical protein
MVGLNAVKDATFGTTYGVLDSVAVHTVVYIVYVAVFSRKRLNLPFLLNPYLHHL